MKQSDKIKQVKQQAKRMSERMNKMGFAVSPRQALEVVAAERGFVTWAAYEASLRKPEPKAPKWSKKQGPMTQAQYLSRRERSNSCPVCGSDAIEGEYVDIDGKFAFQQCTCNDCDSEWTDRYIADAYILHRNGLGEHGQVIASVSAYTVAAYDEKGTFITKGPAFGEDPETAKRFFGEMKRLDANSTQFHVEYEARVEVSTAALVAWWKANDLEEDALDDMVYDNVQTHGLPALNEESSERAQEELIEDGEEQASRINNEGIEAQLDYLLSVCEPGTLLTTLANELSLEGFPPAV